MNIVTTPSGKDSVPIYSIAIKNAYELVVIVELPYVTTLVFVDLLFLRV